MRITGTMGTRLAAAGMAVVVALAAGGAARARPAAQAAQAVSIVDFAFNPQTLTVPAGTRVTWTNTGQAPHTTTADGGAWDSGRMATGATFSFTFSAAGTFAYHCVIHPSMTATITVQGGAAAPAPAAQATAAPAGTARPATGAGAAPAAPRTGTGTGTEAGVTAGWALLAGIGALALAGAAAVRVAAKRRPSRE